MHGATTPYRAREDRSGGGGLLRGWLLCLAMDVLSLRLLAAATDDDAATADRARRLPRRTVNSNNDDNPWRSAEVRRRKLRLLLYLLRSPVWEHQTRPALEGVSSGVLRKVPLLGPLLDTVLWDWVLYYQHPFVAEEG